MKQNNFIDRHKSLQLLIIILFGFILSEIGSLIVVNFAYYTYNFFAYLFNINCGPIYQSITMRFWISTILAIIVFIKVYLDQKKEIVTA